MADPTKLEPSREPPQESILVVDDERSIRDLLTKMLALEGYDVSAAADAQQARLALIDGDFALALVDARMPGESGLGLLTHIRDYFPNTAAIMVTGDDNPALVRSAFEVGAYGYVVKPFRHGDLLIAVTSALDRRAKDLLSRERYRDLEAKATRRQALLRELLLPLMPSNTLSTADEEVMRRLAAAVSMRDVETGAHILRMAQYATDLADALGINGTQRNYLQAAFALHDVGKLTVPDAILQKPGPLTPEERTVMERHTVDGYRLLASTTDPPLRLGATVALTHHERWDGKGYPFADCGSDIPPEGRIAAIADVFDALTSDRVYRPAFEIPTALDMMRAERGRHFDPEYFDAFMSILPTVLETRDAIPDP